MAAKDLILRNDPEDLRKNATFGTLVAANEEVQSCHKQISDLKKKHVNINRQKTKIIDTLLDILKNSGLKSIQKARRANERQLKKITAELQQLEKEQGNTSDRDIIGQLYEM